MCSSGLSWQWLIALFSCKNTTSRPRVRASSWNEYANVHDSNEAYDTWSVFNARLALSNLYIFFGRRHPWHCSFRVPRSRSYCFNYLRVHLPSSTRNPKATSRDGEDCSHCGGIRRVTSDNLGRIVGWLTIVINTPRGLSRPEAEASSLPLILPITISSRGYGA